MIEILWNPTKTQLRQFAGIWFPLFCLLVGWVVGSHTEAWGAVHIAWYIAAFVAIAGLFYPSFIRPVFVALMVIAFPIGWTVSYLLLSLMFYGLVTPVGLMLKRKGRDPLCLRKPRSDSMWVEPIGRKDPGSYLRQY